MAIAGVELHYGGSGRGYISPLLFYRYRADLLNGAKFIGSAQLIHGGAILQHGSIRLEPDAALFAQVFGAQSFNPIQAHPGEALIQSVTEALIAASSCFGVQMAVQPFASLSGRQYLSGASKP